MSSLLRARNLVFVTVLADALTTLYGVYVLGLREASPITALGLSVLGPAYFLAQGLILYTIVRVWERVAGAAAYAIPMLQWLAAWMNLGWILRVIVWKP